ncbi:MAG: hypothetical protein LUO85_05435 [Methanomassiliicoccales archaeon]|nr:hypothetical protein [Methanomassiliicoccales archaeon]
MSLEAEMGPEAMTKAVEEMMRAIALRCVAKGTYLIGHIKSIAEISDGSWLASSVTDLDGKVRSSGGFNAPSHKLSVVINALQYGLKLDQLEVAVEEVVVEQLSRIGKVDLEEISEEHDHKGSHDHFCHIDPG